MSLLSIDRLNVATVYVADLDKAVDFYTDILGFEKSREMAPGVLLYSEGADLNLYVEGGRSVRDEAVGKSSLVALCFNVKEGVKGALAALEAAGVPVVTKYGDLNGGFAGIQFLDPSGNLIEIAGQP